MKPPDSDSDKKKRQPWLVGAEERVVIEDRCSRSKQSQLSQPFVVPVGVGNHAAQCSHGKRIAEAVVCNDDSSAVGVSVDAMAAARALEGESVGVEGLNELAGRDPSGHGGHRLTTTDGEAHCTAPRSGSTGTGSPADRRSST